MSEAAPVRIVHFADPLCWWSWGLEPVLRRLKAVYGDNLEVEYRMGGVFDDLDEWRRTYDVDEESTADWVRESVDLMGMPLHPDFYRESGTSSTYDACRAFRAAILQDRGRAERYFRRMMEAFQVETRPPTREVLASLAEEVGLDGERLLRDLDSETVEKAFVADREAMRSAHANFLSLLISAGEDGVMLGQTFTSTPYEEEIDRLAPDLPKRIPSDLLEYLENLEGHLVPAQEVAEVFHIATEDAADRMRRLEKAGLLASTDYPFGTYWTPQPHSLEKLPLEVVRTSHVTPEAMVESETDIAPIVTSAVQGLYTQVATRPEKEYHFPLGLEALTYLGYDEEAVARLPPKAVESFAGVGHPFAADVIRPGDTVLDVGSGSGTDVLYAAVQVGPEGRVYGVDFTPAMIAKARANIAAMGIDHAEILEGDATDIPLPDESVDVVTSNGVLNLVPDKEAAFREIFRVLRPGGHLQLADIVVEEDVGAVCGINPQLWADCIGGAAVEETYLQTIEEAGFADVKVLQRLDYFSKSPSDYTQRLTKSFGAESLSLVAQRP